MLRPPPPTLHRRAAALEAELRTLGPTWWGSECRYLSTATDAPPGSTVAWAGSDGFYLRRDPAEPWRLIGVEILAARSYVRARRAELHPAPPPPTPGEVLGVVVEVAKFAAPLLAEQLRRRGGA